MKNKVFEYTEGYNAFVSWIPFKNTETDEWQQGWQDAFDDCLVKAFDEKDDEED